MYGKTNLAEIVPEVRKTGAEHIDLWPAPHGDQREQMDAMGLERLTAMLAANRIGLGMTTRYDLGPLRLAEELRLVSKLGGRLLITGSVGPKDVSGPEAKAAVVKFIEQMKPQVAVARSVA